MKQSVNFLKALPQSTVRISALIIVSGTIIFTSILLLISIAMGVKQVQVRFQLNQAKRELIAAQAGYDRMAQAFPLLVSDTPLVNRVKALEEKVIAKRAEIKALEDLLVQRGFSEYLYGLAQAAPNTLWLNQIQVLHHPLQVTLTGYAMSPNAVSDLLGRLMKTEAYSDVVFNLFFVKTVKNRSYVRFSIATHALAPSEEPEMEPSDSVATGSKE